MSANQQLKDFADLYTDVANKLRVQVTSLQDITRIKREINKCYLDKVISRQHWPWLRRTVDIVFKKALSLQCTLTPGSPTVTMTAPIVESVAGYLFGINGDQTRYRIATHVAGSAVLQLEAPFTNTEFTLDTPANVYIW